jgi:hypothetical protein
MRQRAVERIVVEITHEEDGRVRAAGSTAEILPGRLERNGNLP